MSSRAASSLVMLLVGLAATPSRGESALVLPLPARFGEVPAETYDRKSGARLGAGFIRFTRGSDERVRMEALTGIEGGARTRVVADLRPTPDGGGLRLLRQESRSIDDAGRPMGVLEIDHQAREGRCRGPGANGRPPVTKTVALGPADRVANVPLNLLFQPIVRGETDELRFQILLCGLGPRVVGAVARRATTAGGSELVRIRYELSLPRLLAGLTKRWLPQLSFWFDPADSGAWVGHEMPLYSKGPTVLMVRAGVAPATLPGRP